jgi:hypothetical protein
LGRNVLISQLQVLGFVHWPLSCRAERFRILQLRLPEQGKVGGATMTNQKIEKFETARPGDISF